MVEHLSVTGTEPDDPLATDRRLFPLRIRGTWNKALYILTGFAAGIVLNATFPDNGELMWIMPFLVTGFWISCGRCFRGPGESMREPRPWWRMTNRRPASIALACLNMFLLITGTVGLIAIGVVEGVEVIAPATWIDFAGSIILSVLFTTSAIRLRTARAVTPESLDTGEGTFGLDHPSGSD